MTAAQLLAEAGTADREADAIFERVNAAAPAHPLGGRVLVPSGSETALEQASDLRRLARSLRAEAGGGAGTPNTKFVSTAAGTAAPLSPARPAVVEPGRGTRPQSRQSSMTEELQAEVARCLSVERRRALELVTIARASKAPLTALLQAINAGTEAGTFAAEVTALRILNS